MIAAMKDKIALHQRFYIAEPPTRAGRAHFSGAESKHMVASLRLAAGDLVSATNGQGRVFRIRIEEASAKRVAGLVVGASTEPVPEPRIDLYQAIVRPARMDTLVEQAAEFAVARFVPFTCARSVRDAGRERLERWRRIAVDAMKQSLGSHLMEVSSPCRLASAIPGAAGSDTLLVASGPESEPLPFGLLERSRPVRIAVWVGPEGGLTEEEMDALRRAGATPFGLGPQRLRSETAAIATVAALRACLG